MSPITNLGLFEKSLGRLAAVGGGSVVYFTQDRSFRVVIRLGVGEEDETLELGVAPACIESRFEESMISLAADTYYDEDSNVLVLFQYDNIRGDSKQMQAAMENCNLLWKSSLCCCCRVRIIVDGQSECIYCQMTTDECYQRIECSICKCSATIEHMTTLSCCKQMLHSSCLNLWHKENHNCPFCRTTLHHSSCLKL